MNQNTSSQNVQTKSFYNVLGTQQLMVSGPLANIPELNCNVFSILVFNILAFAKGWRIESQFFKKSKQMFLKDQRSAFKFQFQDFVAATAFHTTKCIHQECSSEFHGSYHFMLLLMRPLCRSTCWRMFYFLGIPTFTSISSQGISCSCTARVMYFCEALPRNHFLWASDWLMRGWGKRYFFHRCYSKACCTNKSAMPKSCSTNICPDSCKNLSTIVCGLAAKTRVVRFAQPLASDALNPILR